LPVVAMFVNRLGRNEQSLWRLSSFTFHILIFSSENPRPNELKLGRKHLWKVLSKECTFCSDPLTVVAMFVRNKNCLWRPCLLMDRNKMSILYRGPSIDASYQVSVHLTKRFQRRRFKKICRDKCILKLNF
jgi:hypothetical protein